MSLLCSDSVECHIDLLTADKVAQVFHIFVSLTINLFFLLFIDRIVQFGVFILEGIQLLLQLLSSYTV